MPGDNPHVRTYSDDDGWRWFLIVPGPWPRIVAQGAEPYATEQAAREAGQRVAAVYVVELETD
jgi:hypothetical protein